MIDKSTTTVRNYQKKITAYLDGSLSMDERSEFEGFVATHPEFREEIKAREDEINNLRNQIPQVSLSPRAKESLEHELNQTVFYLLKPAPSNFWDSLKNRFEEWFNR